MRGWCKRSALVVLLVAGVVGCGEDAPPLSAQGCRAAWENLRQTQSENGPPAPPGTATRDRWKDEYADATRQAKRPGDLDTCAADVEAASRRVDRLIDLGTAIQQHDLAAQLVFAERDLEHARELGSFAELPPRLADAFEQLRSAAPAVHDAVATAEAEATDIDLDDGGDVKDLVADIEDAATSTPSYAKGRRALEVIGRYELHEE